MSLEILKKIIEPGQRKLLCMEINPPRGVSADAIYARLDNNLKGIDFLNVTDSALARMRMAAIPFASLLKHRYGLECMVNMSCRDRNLMALQGDLLAGWAMGIRSIVALTGDAVTIGDSPDRKAVFEVNSVGLLHAIQTLNSGKDLAGNELTGKPDYLPGVVVNPNAKNRAAEIKRLKRKAEAGARYALSQPVFDLEVAKLFLIEAQSVGMPIFLGLLPFKTKAGAHGMNASPGIKMSEGLLSKVDAFPGDDVSDLSVQHCLDLVRECSPYVCGFHIISGATPKLAMHLASVVAESLGLRG